MISLSLSGCFPSTETSKLVPYTWNPTTQQSVNRVRP
jgi:hypothetical protein